MVKNFNSNKQTGQKGEDIAKEYLLKNGYEILETNFHFSKQAEIDIIATKDKILHFIEVKTRSQTFFGAPLEAIDEKKLQSIYKCALYYMQNSKTKYKKFQIDGIGIVLKKNDEPSITILENISL